MRYTWFLAAVVAGTPSVREPQTHDDCLYFALPDLAGMERQLSANTLNFLREHRAGNLAL